MDTVDPGMSLQEAPPMAAATLDDEGEHAGWDG